jgi:hypothetical protein
MSLGGIVQAAPYVAAGLFGLALCGVGAYGTVRFRPLNVERQLSVKERLQVTAVGLLLMAAAYVQLAGVP